MTPTLSIAILTLGLVLGAHASIRLGDLYKYKAKERYLKATLVPIGYDKDIRPPGIENADDAIMVKTNMYVMELEFHPEKQEMVLGAYFRQFWTDLRLTSNVGVVGKNDVTLQFRDMFEDRRIWVPDTFVVDDKRGFVQGTPSETGGRSFLRVRADGSVQSSIRIRTNSICPTKKDATEAECTISFESYGYDASEIKYAWKPDEVLLADSAKELLENQGWHLVSHEAKDETIDLSTGTYSRVAFTVKLKKI